MMEEKNEWPELMGMPLERAYQQIRAEFPEIDVRKMPHDSVTLGDFRLQRVRLWYKDGRVIQVPKRG
ncbi:serine protease inhibitor [Streptomyces xanthophaeus]